LKPQTHKDSRTDELVIANKHLAFQYEERQKRATELIIANKELVAQNEEKEKWAAELSIANIELAYQNKEKEKRAAELSIAIKELALQNKEKEKRAEELIIANKELAYQNEIKEKRAAELVIANIELAYQNEEKGKRADELIIANRELLYQNVEKEKRANELVIANMELIYQNKEKENRAEELVIANREVIERTMQLELANKELESFSYSVSHDLRAPLRAVGGYARMLEEDYDALFDDEGKRLLGEVQQNAKKMGILIDDLLSFSRLGRKEIKKTNVDMNALTANMLLEIGQSISHHAQIKFSNLLPLRADHTLMERVMTNLLSNAIKYSSKEETPVISIASKKEDRQIIYSITDNGVGFDMQFGHKLFGVFQRLHSTEEFQGTGVGLAIVQRIIHKHEGRIWAEGKERQGATFFFSMPTNE